jgi:thiamine-phosphate pyrophosphorylase
MGQGLEFFVLKKKGALSTECGVRRKRLPSFGLDETNVYLLNWMTMSPSSPIDWTLCLIADSAAIGPRDISDVIEQAVAGGVTLVQLRAKSWSGREFVETGKVVFRLLKKRKIPLIINDRLDVALACGARGVHIGQEDLPLLDVRRIVGAKRIIGVSVSTEQEARDAEKNGASYVGAGPVFATLSKDTRIPALGPEGLLEIRRAVKIPVLAVGGINPQNAAAVMETGVAGVAVISAVLGRSDVRQAAWELRQATVCGPKIKS